MAKVITDRFEILMAARRVADFACTQGVASSGAPRRATYSHVGALLADSVLQAGLNYHSVVKPRVDRILKQYPNADHIKGLSKVVQRDGSDTFLNWKHSVKINRFDNLISFFKAEHLDTIADIREAIVRTEFQCLLQRIHGIGPKTVDYISCLVGVESIAVDRHIKTFARNAGIPDSDYDFLKSSFCFAADLLSISRREFDAWIWAHESQKGQRQLGFKF